MELSPFQNIHSHKHLVPQPISTLFQLFQALVSLTSPCLSRLQPPFLLILSQVRIKLSYLILSYLINPLTAIGIFDVAKRKGSPAFIHTVSNS